MEISINSPGMCISELIHVSIFGKGSTGYNGNKSDNFVETTNWKFYDCR